MPTTKYRVLIFSFWLPVKLILFLVVQEFRFLWDAEILPNHQIHHFLPQTWESVTCFIFFAQKGLSLEESVAIKGAHTLGITHCYNIESRLYDDPKSDEPNEHEFEIYLKLSCPKSSLTSNISFVLNEPTILTFDNHYFINGRGVLRIDAEIPFHLLTTPYVQRFAADQDAFFKAFSFAFVKLSTYGVLTGSQGIIIRRSGNALS